MCTHAFYTKQISTICLALSFATIGSDMKGSTVQIMKGITFTGTLEKSQCFRKLVCPVVFFRGIMKTTPLAKILCLPSCLWWQHLPYPCKRYFVVRKSFCSAPQHFQVYQRSLDEWPLELTPQMVYDTKHCLLRNTLYSRVCCPSTAERVKSAWKLMDQKLFWI